MTTCKCDNCNWTGDESALRCTIAETPDLKLRLDAGDTVPAGECPECGCFAYFDEPTCFSVLLSRPDYVAGSDLDTYFTSVVAANPTEAVKLARLEAAACDGCEPEAAIDYAVLLVIGGEHDDLNPES